MSTTTLDNPAIAAAMQAAYDAIRKGNLQKADLLCRQALAQDASLGVAWQLLAVIAHRVGANDLALQYDTTARQHLSGSESVLPLPLPPRAQPTTPRYLLIKAWGFGFWADLDHVYGALLLAELTGRIPLVHWGRNSLFRGPDTVNAFECFFEPVSGLKWADLIEPELSYFPAKWNAENLSREDHQKWSGQGSRLTGLYGLERPENVVVSDFHIKVNDLMPWIPASSPLYGLDRNSLYRYLSHKYIRLRPEQLAKVDAWWQARMAGRPWLAVHVRGTDKTQEVAHLAELNAAYATRIDQILSVHPSLSIFLMTDSEQILQEYKARYGNKVAFTDCQRGKGQTGVHLEGHPGILMGEQVILDAYLATRCDFFLGNGSSNVSTGIRHLKNWRKGTFFVVGPDFLGETDLSLHEW